MQLDAHKQRQRGLGGGSRIRHGDEKDSRIRGGEIRVRVDQQTSSDDRKEHIVLPREEKGERPDAPQPLFCAC